jgi:hypothetical protein
MKLYETLALDSDVGKMDITAEASFVLMHEILYILNVIRYESWCLTDCYELLNDAQFRLQLRGGDCRIE